MKHFSSKEEVHNYAIENIVNKPFGELAKEYDIDLSKKKNGIGDLFEACYGKEKDSASEPDLGVAELKATPYKALSTKNKYSAKERLVLNIINYDELVDESFNTSHFLHKNKVIELAFYQYLKSVPRSQWTFSHVALFEMSKNPADFAIIKHDWETIKKYVDEGHADQLSESLTDYLAACTKGKNRNHRRSQPHSNIKAKQRAFSFKAGYMTQLLRKYILGNEENEAIIKDSLSLKNNSLRKIITKKFKPYIGLTTKQIAAKLGVHNTKSKQFNSLLARKMLGLSSSRKDLKHIDELEKSSTIIKTIQFDVKGKNKESMSFPAFKFIDLANETWEDSDGSPSASFNALLSESTFVFLVFQRDSHNDNYFRGIKFYNFPREIIDGPIYEEWKSIQNTINDGIEFTYTEVANKKSPTGFSPKIKNNVPKGNIIHIRPHTSVSSYVCNSNSNKLPTAAHWTNYTEVKDTEKFPKIPQYWTTQCFWLKNTFVRTIVKDLLK